MYLRKGMIICLNDMCWSPGYHDLITWLIIHWSCTDLVAMKSYAAFSNFGGNLLLFIQVIFLIQYFLFL